MSIWITPHHKEWEICFISKEQLASTDPCPQEDLNNFRRWLSIEALTKKLESDEISETDYYLKGGKISNEPNRFK